VDLSSPYKPLGFDDHKLIDAALWHLLPLIHCAPGHAQYPSQCSLRTRPFNCLFFGHPYSVLYIHWPRVRVSPSSLWIAIYTINSMRGKATPYYGKLMTDTLPHEVKAIWYSRDSELPELPRHGWSWEHQTDTEAIEKHDLVVKLLEAIPLTEREDFVVRLVVLENETFRDVGDQLDCTTERARQIYMKAIRKLRTKQAAVTGIAIWPYECEVNTWRAWKHFEKNRP